MRKNAKMEEFYIDLLSNVKTAETLSAETNTMANFTTILPKILKLRGDWEVGLTEISFTKSWYNVNNDYTLKLYTESSIDHGAGIIRKGYYGSVEQLVDSLNQVLEKANFNVIKSKNNSFTPPRVIYDKLSGKVTVKAGKHDESHELIFPYFGREVSNILGLRHNRLDTRYELFESSMEPDIELSLPPDLNDLEKAEGRMYSERIVDIKAGIYNFFVYCDIIQSTIVGNVEIPILRLVTIPDENKFGEQCHIIFEKPYYVKVLSNEIQRIGINIKGDAGEDIKFLFGRVSLRLHFRKWKNTT